MYALCVHLTVAPSRGKKLQFGQGQVENFPFKRFFTSLLRVLNKSSNSHDSRFYLDHEMNNFVDLSRLFSHEDFIRIGFSHESKISPGFIPKIFFHRNKNQINQDVHFLRQIVTYFKLLQ